MTPTEISVATGFKTGHVSDVLVGLKGKEVVECKNPNVRKGRLYTYTEKGGAIMASLKKIKIKS